MRRRRLLLALVVVVSATLSVAIAIAIGAVVFSGGAVPHDTIVYGAGGVYTPDASGDRPGVVDADDLHTPSPENASCDPTPPVEHGSHAGQVGAYPGPVMLGPCGEVVEQP